PQLTGEGAEQCELVRSRPSGELVEAERGIESAVKEISHSAHGPHVPKARPRVRWLVASYQRPDESQEALLCLERLTAVDCPIETREREGMGGIARRRPRKRAPTTTCADQLADLVEQVVIDTDNTKLAPHGRAWTKGIRFAWLANRHRPSFALRTYT